MLPAIQALLDSVKPPHTREIQALTKKIQLHEKIIKDKISFESLNYYTDLYNQRSKLENAAYFEQGFFTCAQLFVEILSKYSS